MNDISKTLDKINTSSINLIHEENNDNEDLLETIKKLVDEHKKNGYKYPLLACVFLLFYNSGKKILKKSELYSLMEKEIINNKNKIISSPTERYCIITQQNFKSKIKDIIKNKKWLTRNINESGENEYTLSPGAVSSVIPKIISYLKVLVKNNSMFNNEKDKNAEIIEIDKIDNIKEAKKTKETKDINDKKETKKNIKKNKNESIIINKSKIYTKNKKKNKKDKQGKNNNSDKNYDYDIIIEDDEDVDENNNKNKVKIINISEKEIIIQNDSIHIKEMNEDKKNKENEKIIKKNNHIDNLNNKYLNKKRKANKLKLNKKKKIKKIKEKSKDESKPSLTFETIEIKNAIEEKTDEDSNNNQNQFQEEKILKNEKKEENEINILNNKINSIINIGELFLNISKNNELSNLISKKINSMKEKIEIKEKEINLEKIFLEKLIINEEKVKSVNQQEIEEKIKQIKNDYNEYKLKIIMLLNYKKIINDNNNKKDIKDAKNNYEQNYSKCVEILEKMIFNLSMLFKYFIKFEDLLNLLCLGEKGKNKLSMKGITDLENYGNLFKKILGNTIIDDKINKTELDSAKIVKSDFLEKDNKIGNKESIPESFLNCDIKNNNQ